MIKRDSAVVCQAGIFSVNISRTTRRKLFAHTPEEPRSDGARMIPHKFKMIWLADLQI
jgi:hypothetical protein